MLFFFPENGEATAGRKMSRCCLPLYRRTENSERWHGKHAQHPTAGCRIHIVAAHNGAWTQSATAGLATRARLCCAGRWEGGGGVFGMAIRSDQMISLVIDLHLASELLFQVSVQNAWLISQRVTAPAWSSTPQDAKTFSFLY